MARRVAKLAVLLAMTVAAALLFLDILYFARGSLEQFPTEEQDDKIRVVTAVIAVALIVVELGLWHLLRSLDVRQSRVISSE